MATWVKEAEAHESSSKEKQDISSCQLPRLIWGLVASVALHGLFVGLMTLAPVPTAPKMDRSKPVTVDFEVVEKPEPPKVEEVPTVEAEPKPEPVPEIEPEKPVPPEPPPKPKAKKPKALPKKAPEPLPVASKEPPKAEPPTSDLPPPPNQTPPANAAKSAPIKIGISLSSTSSEGAFAASVGNTLYGTGPKVAADPNSVRPYAPDATASLPANTVSEPYVPPSRVTRLPKILGEVKADYPEEARRRGIEGKVVLKLRVSSSGKVIDAKVVEKAGNGFDEAAIKAVMQMRFSPGMKDGQVVSTDITYTYMFLLD